MQTMVTRLVVTTIVATCVFASTRVQAQEHVASKPRVKNEYGRNHSGALAETIPSMLLRRRTSAVYRFGVRNAEVVSSSLAPSTTMFQ